MADVLLESIDETGVCTLTLNRPDCLNAFDDELSYALQDALKKAERNSEVRCLILTGAGRGFCAGQDLQSRTVSTNNGATVHLGESIEKRYAPIINKLTTMEKPIIAMVNGVAAGAGASLALACDLRVAGESASFIQAFVKVGLIPDSGACWLLPRLIGMGRAMEVMMTGNKIKAQQALDWGMVNWMVPDDQLESETRALAQQFSQGPTKALGLMKRASRMAVDMDLGAYLKLEAQLQEVAGRTQDFKEGVAAFTEKRTAAFKGC